MAETQSPLRSLRANWNSKTKKITLVGGLVAIFYFPRNIGLLIIPIDFHIFQRGSNHQPDNHGELSPEKVGGESLLRHQKSVEKWDEHRHDLGFTNGSRVRGRTATW